MFQVDWMRAIPLTCQLARVSVISTVLHVLVNRICNITGPEGLNRADTAICAYIASETTACNYLAQTIDVCTIWQCGCNLLTAPNSSL